jgi:hypothetical protein
LAVAEPEWLPIPADFIHRTESLSSHCANIPAGHPFSFKELIMNKFARSEQGRRERPSTPVASSSTFSRPCNAVRIEGYNSLFTRRVELSDNLFLTKDQQ